MTLDSLLSHAVRVKASDVHLKAGHPPLFRLHGYLVPHPEGVLIEENQLQALAFGMLYDEQKARFAERYELDFSYTVPGIARVRANLHYHLNGMGLVMRLIDDDPPTPEEIMLPAVLTALCKRPQGLVLLTGPTGSGKSTTLACMVGIINRSVRKHVLTIEDPVEFVHKSDQCVITQREVGAQTHSFANALRAGLRQDPDVIMVGEMRDLETIALAMTAAETGHLVMSTLHTSSATQTIDRVIDVFPPAQQQQVRTQLASTLTAVVSQRLLPRADSNGNVAAREIMMVNPAIAALIRDGNAHQIPNAIFSGADQGMVSLDQDLARLVRSGIVTLEVAATVANDPMALTQLSQAAPAKRGLFG
ncbi:MAG: type IV pilus twitching motility protein PilT [Candidatus Eremiobacterota bacterium]